MTLKYVNTQAFIVSQVSFTLSKMVQILKVQYKHTGLLNTRTLYNLSTPINILTSVVLQQSPTLNVSKQPWF